MDTNLNDALMPYDMYKVKLLANYTEYGVVKHYQKGECVFKAGERVSSLFYVMNGAVEVYIIREDGRDWFFYLADEHVVIDRLFESNKAAIYGMAAENVTLCLFNEAAVRKMMEENADVGFELMKSLNCKVNYQLNRTLTVDSMSAPRKVCRLLYNLCINQGEVNGTEYTIRMDLSQKLLGNMLDIHPVTVSRIMGYLQDSRVISKCRKQIIVLDLVKLKEYAENDFLSFTY